MATQVPRTGMLGEGGYLWPRGADRWSNCCSVQAVSVGTDFCEFMSSRAPRAAVKRYSSRNLQSTSHKDALCFYSAKNACMLQLDCQFVRVRVDAVVRSCFCGLVRKGRCMYLSVCPVSRAHTYTRRIRQPHNASLADEQRERMI